MFDEKALIDNITLSHSINACKSGDWALQKEGKRVIYLSNGGTI